MKQLLGLSLILILGILSCKSKKDLSKNEEAPFDIKSMAQESCACMESFTQNVKILESVDEDQIDKDPELLMMVDSVITALYAQSFEMMNCNMEVREKYKIDEFLATQDSAALLRIVTVMDGECPELLAYVKDKEKEAEMFAMIERMKKKVEESNGLNQRSMEVIANEFCKCVEPHKEYLEEISSISSETTDETFDVEALQAEDDGMPNELFRCMMMYFSYLEQELKTDELKQKFNDLIFSKCPYAAPIIE